MKWADLCMVPGQEHNCIQIIKYVVMHNIVHPQSFISMTNIELHNKVSSIDWIFMQEFGGEYLFCEMPSCWRVNIVQESMFGSTCDFHTFHRTVHFLNSVYKGVRSRPEWKKLLQLVAMLRSELPKYCALCHERAHQLEKLPPMINEFIRHPVSDLEKTILLANKHHNYMTFLFQQTKHHKDITEIIRQSFEKIKSLYTESLLSDIPDDTAVTGFRRNVIESLRQRFSFITTKPIDFKEWLYCLFYMDQLQINTVEEYDWTTYIMKKIWLLLNLYFTEKQKSDAQEIHIYIQEWETIIEEIEMDTEDVERMKGIHPIERPGLLP